LPYAKFDKFNSPVFFGRRWDWVDPRSEAMADAAAVALGTKSRAQLIRERGRDPDEVWAELKTEEDLGFSVPNGSNADQQDAQN
jgi:capsid protein